MPPEEILKLEVRAEPWGMTNNIDFFPHRSFEFHIITVYRVSLSTIQTSYIIERGLPPTVAENSNLCRLLSGIDRPINDVPR